MLQLNLFLELLEVITQLIKDGADSNTSHEARLAIDSLVADFEESQGIVIEEDKGECTEGDDYSLKAMLNRIATKERTMPQELREYFLMVESPQSEIFFRGLPPLPESETPEVAKLKVEIFAVLNDLLKVGLTSCNVHQARMQLDSILAVHEQL